MRTLRCPAHESFKASRRTEREYERRLRAVAGQIRGIIKTGGSPEDIEKQLRAYAEILEPWARRSAATMLRGAAQKNKMALQRYTRRMGQDMKRLLDGPGVGEAVRKAIEGNVRLIKTLPLEAADKVGAMAREALSSGSRAEDIARRIARVGEISESRARVIARTEVSKAGTALTRARAEEVGSRGYIWRTARDGDTRPSHRAMEGEYVPWDKPVTLDNMTGHAGEFPNCRCFPEPVIPRDDGGVYKPSLPTAAQERNAGEKRLLSQWERQEGSPVVMPEEGRLPNAQTPLDVEDRLRLYTLNPDHPTGAAKAEVIKAAIGMDITHLKDMQAQIEEYILTAQVAPGQASKHGAKFEIFVPVTGPNGKTVDVLTVWMYKRRKDRISLKPEMITAFVPKGAVAR